MDGRGDEEFYPVGVKSEDLNGKRILAARLRSYILPPYLSRFEIALQSRIQSSL